MTLQTRLTIPDDLPALCGLLNHIIQLGGTTAHQTVKSLDGFRAHYFDDPLFVHTVLKDDRPVGFQAVFDQGGGGLAIGSFTDQQNPVQGAGIMLFAATHDAARAADAKYIDAKIRADNVPGLAYYSKLGFVDFKLDKDVPLTDGTPMDRITKRYTL